MFWLKLLFCHPPAISSLPLRSQKYNSVIHSNGTSQETQTFFSGSKKFTSVGCNWLILIHVVFFVSW